MHVERTKCTAAGLHSVVLVTLVILVLVLGMAFGCGGGSRDSAPPTVSPQPTPAPTTPNSQPAPSSAQEYFVAPSGSDNNSGSESSPWATIQHAAAVVMPGNTVHVAPGTYSNLVNTTASGTATSRIRFISDVKWGAQINTVGVSVSWENHGDYVDIMGFSISGDGNLGILNQGSNVRMIANEVHNVPIPVCTDDGGAGIDDANYSAQNDDIIANFVHDIGSLSRGCPRVQGIYHANFGGHIWNNVSIRNEAWGISLWHAANAVVVANNLSSQNGAGGIEVGAGDAPGGVTADNIVVTNNVIVYNGNGSSGAGILETGATGPNNLYGNNVVFGNPINIELQTGTANNTVVADPDLLNAPNPQSLCDNSFIRNNGISRDAPPNDANGAPRPNPPDIGPFQCGAADPAWPWM